jgi:hypothetical protein
MSAPAMTSGLNRVLLDAIAFTYQGDGDLASIGLAEILRAAAQNQRARTLGAWQRRRQGAACDHDAAGAGARAVKRSSPRADSSFRRSPINRAKMML